MDQGGDGGTLARMQALEAEVRRLRDAEARLRAVFDQTYQLIGLLDLEGTLVDANQRALEFAGATRADVVGRAFADTPWWAHDPELQARVRDAVVAARAGAMVRFEATHVAASGALHTVDFSLKPLLSGEGVITHLVCEGRDISARKAVEESLRASRKMMALVLDSIPVRVFWKDVELRYLGCNMAFARDAGLASPEAIIGCSDLELSWRTEAERYRSDDRAVIESGVPRIAYEEPQTTPDGAEMWLRTSKVPLRDAEERVVGVLGVYEDVTARKQVENERLAMTVQVQRTQRLESLGVLAGGIAHDFNNLLTVVLGSVDLLRVSGVNAGGVDQGLRAIAGAAHRAGELCRQLLAYSGRGRFMVQAVDLNAMAREAADGLRASRAGTGSVEVVTAPGALVVEADAAQIRQLLMNLLTNAWEALPDPRDVITLRTSRATIGEGELHDEYAQEPLPPGGYAVVEVIDSGVGLDDDTRARIFEPFFTTKFTGRGLGLAAVLGIVRGHRGAVQVTSAPRAGSCFRVLLPSCEAPPEAGDRVSPVSPITAPWRGAGSVLLVDDEAVIREVGSALLRHLGFEVDTADDGRACLERFSGERHVCVILDVTMPRLDGVQAMRALRSTHPGARIVLSSGYDAAEVKSRLEGEQPDAFLEKPFTLAALERVLRGVLG